MVTFGRPLRRGDPEMMFGDIARIRGGGVLPADFSVVIGRTADGSVTQTYTATPSVAGTYAYQWFWVGGADIVGAKSQTYVAQSTDLGRTLGCRVTRVGMVSVIGLAAGPVLMQPLILAALDSLTETGLTKVGLANWSLDTTTKIQGVASIEADNGGVATSGSTYLQKTNVYNGLPADLDTVGCAVILEAEPEFQTLSNIELRFGRGGTYYSQAGITQRTMSRRKKGTAWISYPVAQVPALAALGSGQFDFRLFPNQSTAPYCARPRVDAVAARIGGVPTIGPTFDDGRKSIITDIFPIMQARGLVGTFYCPTKLIGGTIGGEPCMDWDDVRTLLAAGWSIAIDLTDDDNYVGQAGSAWLTLAAVVANFPVQWQRLADQGVASDAMYHACAPNGTLDTTPTYVNLTGAVSDGSDIVTVSSIAGLSVGMRGAGFLVTRGTTILEVGATTIRLSASVPAGTSNMSFADFSGEFATGKPRDAYQAAGLRTLRQTNPGHIHTRFGFGANAMDMLGNSMSATIAGEAADTATVISYNDLAVNNKDTVITYAHGIRAGGEYGGKPHDQSACVHSMGR